MPIQPRQPDNPLRPTVKMLRFFAAGLEKFLALVDGDKHACFFG
jgi:hypothetical protein